MIWCSSGFPAERKSLSLILRLEPLILLVLTFSTHETFCYTCKHTKTHRDSFCVLHVSNLLAVLSLLGSSLCLFSLIIAFGMVYFAAQCHFLKYIYIMMLWFSYILGFRPGVESFVLFYIMRKHPTSLVFVNFLQIYASRKGRIYKTFSINSSRKR